jgi:hypothetical protein
MLLVDAPEGYQHLWRKVGTFECSAGHTSLQLR